jgi:putative Holliday junction resolvase
MMTTNKTFLGLDVGTRFIGVAVGQTITKTATPLSVVHVNNNQLDWQRLDQLIQTWQPSGIVIGIPMLLIENKNPIVEFIQNIGHEVYERYSIPIFWKNEDFTTIEAKAKLFLQKKSKGLTKENIDCYSAKIILEDWLCENSTTI